MLRKSDVVNKLAEKSGISKKSAETILCDLISIIEDSVINDDGVQFTGSFTITTKRIGAKQVINPATKQPMMTKESKSLAIKTGSILKSKLNK